jgi:ABC-2 type transport system permease protein
MPAVLRAFADNQPLTHVIDTMRALLVGAPLDSSGWLSVIWCVGIIAVSAPLAIHMFRNRTR